MCSACLQSVRSRASVRLVAVLFVLVVKDDKWDCSSDPVMGS